MIKRMTPREFRDYSNTHSAGKISFWSENQKRYDESASCKVRLTFDSMAVFLNPNVIYLRDGENVVYFDNVKYIELDNETTVLGTLLTLFCGCRESGDTYRLIAM